MRDMTDQFRDIIEKALATRQPVSVAERFDVYKALRARLNVVITQREPPIPDQRKIQLFHTLEAIIAEMEERFTSELPCGPTISAPPFDNGVSEMTTKSTGTAPNPEKSGSGRTALIAGIALVAIATAGGWYWWSQQGSNCVVGTEAAVPLALHNVTDEDGRFTVTGSDPQLILRVPNLTTDRNICLVVDIQSGESDIVEIFLPDPESAIEGFVAGRSIQTQFDAGENTLEIELPAYSSNRQIRLDPGVGRSNVSTSVSSIRFGTF